MGILNGLFTVDLSFVLARHCKNNNDRWQTDEDKDKRDEQTAVHSPLRWRTMTLSLSVQLLLLLLLLQFDLRFSMVRSEYADIQQRLTFWSACRWRQTTRTKKSRLIFRFRGKWFSRGWETGEENLVSIILVPLTFRRRRLLLHARIPKFVVSRRWRSNETRLDVLLTVAADFGSQMSVRVKTGSVSQEQRRKRSRWFEKKRETKSRRIEVEKEKKIAGEQLARPSVLLTSSSSSSSRFSFSPSPSSSSSSSHC